MMKKSLNKKEILSFYSNNTHQFSDILNTIQDHLDVANYLKRSFKKENRDLRDYLYLKSLISAQRSIYSPGTVSMHNSFSRLIIDHSPAYAKRYSNDSNILRKLTANITYTKKEKSNPNYLLVNDPLSII